MLICLIKKIIKNTSIKIGKAVNNYFFILFLKLIHCFIIR